jgi:hypothetical protein
LKLYGQNSWSEMHLTFSSRFSPVVGKALHHPGPASGFRGAGGSEQAAVPWVT